MLLKMIVCDMDGTLLTSEHKIAPKTQKKLLELQEQGIKVVLASGRGYIRLLPDARKLLLNKYNGFLIDANGTSIYDVEKEERRRIGILDSNDINEINNYFSAFNVELQYSQDDTIYTYLTNSIYEIKRNIRGEMKLPEDYPWTGGMYSWFTDTRDGYPHQILIRNFSKSPENCNKIQITQEVDYMELIRESLVDSVIAERYEIVFSDQRKLEITNKGINKGYALSLLMNHLNIQNDEVIIFGDSENDISMFENKKFSVAMDNGLLTAKKAANYLTNSHNDEGIYNMLMKFEENGAFEQ